MPYPYYNVLRAASGVKTSASSALGSFNSWYAIDGQIVGTNSRWVSNVGTAGEYWSAEFNAIAAISKIIMYSGNSPDNIAFTNCINNVDFQLRINGKWVTVSEVRNNPTNGGYKVERQLSKTYFADAIRLYFPIASDNFRIFEVEAYGRVIGKPAKGLVPVKNLIQPVTGDNWRLKSGQTMPILESDYKIRLKSDTAKVVGYDFPVQLDVNKTYTVGAKNTGSGARLRVIRADNESSIIANILPDTPVLQFKPPVTSCVIRVENNGQVGEFTVEDFFLYEGSILNPKFERYDLNMKKAVRLSGKNLFDNKQSLMVPSATMTIAAEVLPDGLKVSSTSGNTMAVEYIQNANPIKLTVGKTYTLSAIKSTLTNNQAKVRIGYLVKGGNINNAGDVKTIAYLVGNTYTFTVSSGQDDIVLGFYAKDASESGVNVCIYDKVQLEEGSTATTFERYKHKNKPAIKGSKNLILPYSKNPWSFSNSSLVPQSIKDYPFMSVDGEYAFTMTNKTEGWQCAFFFIPVKPNTVYVYSNKFEGANNQALRLDGFKANKTTSTGALFNGNMPIQSNGKGSYAIKTGSETEFIRVILQNFAAGTYKFSEFQLEEGVSLTSFEPYRYGSKSTATKKNIFNDDISKFTVYQSLSSYGKDGNNIYVSAGGTGALDSPVMRLKKGNLYTVKVRVKTDSNAISKVALVDKSDRLTWLVSSEDVLKGQEKILTMSWTPSEDKEAVLRLYTGRNATSGTSTFSEIEVLNTNKNGARSKKI